jgi:hypothetical protein
MGLSSGWWSGLGEATTSGMARLHRLPFTNLQARGAEGAEANHRGQGRGRSLPRPLLWCRRASKENIMIGGTRQWRDVTSSRGTSIPPSLCLGPARWDKGLGGRGEDGGGGRGCGGGGHWGRGGLRRRAGGGGTPPGRGLERGAIFCSEFKL